MRKRRICRGLVRKRFALGRRLLAGSESRHFVAAVAEPGGSSRDRYAEEVGEDEIAAGKCSVKDMRSGEQVTITPAEAAELILNDKRKAENAAVILEK